jgi:hypothetical protein
MTATERAREGSGSAAGSEPGSSGAVGPRPPDPPLSAEQRARGRRIAITSHALAMTFSMVLQTHLPTLALVSLGASEGVIGLQSALKLGDFLQLPALRAVARVSKRQILFFGQLVALFGAAPLIAFPGWLESSKAHPTAVPWLALLCFAVVMVGLRIGDAVWFPLLRAYMEPGGIGRFFGTIRSFWHLALIVYYLGAHWWLGAHPNGFGLLFGAAWICGLTRLAFILRMPERGERTGQRIRVREAFALIRDDVRLRRYLIGATWATAVRVTVIPFTIVMMRREAGFSSADVLVATVASFAGGLASLYGWGRVIDRFGAEPVFRGSCIGLGALTSTLTLVEGAGTAPLVGLVLFFFLHSVLTAGFGVADTHVLFRLTPPEAPARTLVIASVVVGALSSVAPIVIGFGLDRAIASASRPLFVYHALFGGAALLQALAFLPLRGLDRAAGSDASVH